MSVTAPEAHGLRLAIVCEANEDRYVYTALVDRVLLAGIDWLDEEILAYARTWVGGNAGEAFLPVKDISARYQVEAAAHRLPRLRGEFTGSEVEAEYFLARKALLLLEECSELRPEGVVLARDSDREISRREGWRQARDRHRWSFPIVICVPERMLESWLLAGFDPRDPAEAARLEQVTRELGFDPRCRAEKLTAQDEQAKGNPKRVLNELTGPDRTRRRQCAELAPLEVLAQRGLGTGLTECLQEIEARLVPLFSGRSVPPHD